eukprot:ctg_698.g346
MVEKREGGAMAESGGEGNGADAAAERAATSAGSGDVAAAEIRTGDSVAAAAAAAADDDDKVGVPSTESSLAADRKDDELDYDAPVDRKRYPANTVQTPRAQECERALARDRWDAEAWTALVAEAQRRPLNEAQSVYERALHRFPTSGKFWHLYLEHLIREGHTDEAERRFAYALPRGAGVADRRLRALLATGQVRAGVALTMERLYQPAAAAAGAHRSGRGATGPPAAQRPAALGGPAAPQSGQFVARAGAVRGEPQQCRHRPGRVPFPQCAYSSAHRGARPQEPPREPASDRAGGAAALRHAHHGAGAAVGAVLARRNRQPAVARTARAARAVGVCARAAPGVHVPHARRLDRLCALHGLRVGTERHGVPAGRRRGAGAGVAGLSRLCVGVSGAGAPVRSVGPGGGAHRPAAGAQAQVAARGV